MLPTNPPGGLLASLTTDLTFLAYLLSAEALAVVSTWALAALDTFSRASLMDLAREEGREEQVTTALAHAGRYELGARLSRFLGTAMLVVGIAFLTLRDHIPTAAPSDALFPWAGVATAVGVIFVLNFLVNDVLIRLLARRNPERFVLRMLPLFEALRYATAPLRVPLSLLAGFLFRVRLEDPGPTARDEVLESVEEGEREGSLTADEAGMIESIMDLDRVTVDQICTPRGEVAMVQEGTSLDAAVKFALADGHRRIPVYGRDRDDVVGVVYALDLLERVSRPHGPTTVREIMRSPFFVPEGKPLNDLLAEMRRRRVSLAVVLNEFGGTSGVVTMEDVLEEIVGDIEDEHDRTEPTPRPVRDGTLLVDGRTTIEDVNEALKIELPVQEDFETVGGLVFHEMGKVPAAGDQVCVENVRLTVTEADERRVRRVRVQVLPPAPE